MARVMGSEARARLMALAYVGLSVLLVVVPGDAVAQGIHGTATYEAQRVVPAGAIFEATLLDVSRADAAARVIGTSRQSGQQVGITQVGERIWLVTFMQYDLGYFDDETCRLEPIENPFGPKVLPMCPE
jgi:Type III secretion system lipoprotein chaperone (YscW)